jgi:hypothetical protein
MREITSHRRLGYAKLAQSAAHLIAMSIK